MSDWKEYQVKDIIQVVREGYKPNINDEIPYLGLEHINEQSAHLGLRGKWYSIDTIIGDMVGL